MLYNCRVRSTSLSLASRSCLTFTKERRTTLGKRSGGTRRSHSETGQRTRDQPVNPPKRFLGVHPQTSMFFEVLSLTYEDSRALSSLFPEELGNR